MRKHRATVPLVGLFAVMFLTYAAIRSTGDPRPPRPLKALGVETNGREATPPQAVRSEAKPTESSSDGVLAAAAPTQPTPPPDLRVPQPAPGADRSTVDGTRLRARMIELLTAGKLDEAEFLVNGAVPAEIEAALDAAGTSRIEALFPTLSIRGRRLAAWILSKSPQRDVSGFLALALRTEAEEEVRQSIVMALQARPDEEAGRGIAAALGGDPSASVRACAAYALGERAGKESGAREALATRLASDGSTEVRAACATAIGLVASKDSTSALMEALDSPVAEVRLAAAQALGRQDGFASADALAARQTAESDASVRAALGESQLALEKKLSIEMVGGCDRHED